MALKRKESVVKHREINPVVSAILNFIIWGTGYIYNGRKLVFGILLLISLVVLHTHIVFYLGIRWYISYPGVLTTLFHLLLSMAFAYDGYRDAKE